MTVSSALFSCENVCLSLGGRRILTNVSIDVNPGEIVGLVGPNGAGKTSLFEVLCGRYNQESGKVSMGEQDLSNIAFFQRAIHPNLLRYSDKIGKLFSDLFYAIVQFDYQLSKI